MTRFNIVILENGANEFAINLCFESVANGSFDKQCIFSQELFAAGKFLFTLLFVALVNLLTYISNDITRSTDQSVDQLTEI